MNEIKEVKLTARVPVIRDPLLIKVSTISVKVVVQMPWIPTDANWDGLEAIGRIPTATSTGVTVLRHSKSGHFSRVADGVFLDYRAKQMEKYEQLAWPQARDKAQAELADMPQLFVV